MIQCKHWQDCGIRGGGCCAIGEYFRPMAEVCATLCTAYDGPSRGAGDLVAKAIKKATNGKVTPCDGCGKRQMAYNRMIPFREG